MRWAKAYLKAYGEDVLAVFMFLVVCYFLIMGK